MVIRHRDNKIINVAKQKVSVHESCYTQPLVWEPSANDAEKTLTEATSASVDCNLNEDTMIQTQRSADESHVTLPETDRNMVQSIKTLRDHRIKQIGTSHQEMTDLEESAIYDHVDQIREGLFLDTVILSDVDQLTNLVEEDISQGISMKDAIIRAIRNTSQVKHSGDLAKGKKQLTLTDISDSNILTSKK